MIDELNDLYGEMILDHNARPHNFGKLDNATHQAHGYNPLCGDEIQVFLKLNHNDIEQISFVGQGCAISKASASIMTDALKGQSLENAGRLFEQFHTLVAGSKELPSSEIEALGKISVFQGVKQFPARVKCATLAWHTVKAALQNEQKPVCTE